MKTKTIASRRLVRIGLIAAVQLGLILGLAPLAFGPFQFRVSNVMNIFPFIFGFDGFVGVLLGGLLASFFAPYGIPDIVLGGILSAGTVLGMTWYFGVVSRKRNQKQPWLFFALMTSPVGTTFWVGYLLLNRVFQIPLVPMIPYFIVEELLTSALGGYLVYKAISTLRKGKIEEL